MFYYITAVSRSQFVWWKTADLLTSTDQRWQRWQPLLTAWCFYFAHISGNTKARHAPVGSNWPLGQGATFMFPEQNRFGRQIFDFGAFLFFNLVFDPVNVGHSGHSLVQKLRMDVLYMWQKDGLSPMGGLEFRWGDVWELDPDLAKNCY